MGLPLKASLTVKGQLVHRVTESKSQWPEMMDKAGGKTDRVRKKGEGGDCIFGFFHDPPSLQELSSSNI